MSQDIAKAVGHIPSGLFIICAKEGEQYAGYLASWVQQVSFNPLMVSFAINPGRPGRDSIISGEIFTINIVGEHEMGYLKHFWSGYDKPPFDLFPHHFSPNKGLIIDQAKSTIECRFHSKIVPGDHELVVAEVVASYVQNTEVRPKVHIRKSGLDY